MPTVEITYKMQIMTRIEIEKLRLRTIIGVNDWERDNLQDVVVSVGFSYDAQQAEKTDRIEDTVNYKSLTVVNCFQIVSLTYWAQL